MPQYLFETQIATGLARAERDHNLKATNEIKNLRTQAQERTATLRQQHHPAPHGNYQAVKAAAEQLATSMGQFPVPRPRPQHHYKNYCNLELGSAQATTVRNKVMLELKNVHDRVELDVTHHDVIGQMFYIAAMIHSVIDEYQSPGQNEGRR